MYAKLFRALPILVLAAGLATWGAPAWAATLGLAAGVDDDQHLARLSGVVVDAVDDDQHLAGLSGVVTDAGDLAETRAATFGLVIGIDDYQHLAGLNGAVADAGDIAEALRAAGAEHVTLLTDGDATRAAIDAAWRDITRRAAPGDTVIVGFAGRAAPDAVLLLAGFRASPPGNGERITRSQWLDWFAGAPRLNILFIADTFFAKAGQAGAPTRAIDPRAPRMEDRAAAPGAIADDELAPPTPGAARRTAADLPHLTVLWAGGDGEPTPEVMIDGVPRGALSWVAARALSDRADGNGDGRLSLGELLGYVQENVRMLTERRQHPQVDGAAPASTVLIELPAGLRTGSPVARTVGLRVLGADADEAGFLRHAIGANIVLFPEDPHALIWDRAGLAVLNTLGDVVATLPTNDNRLLRRIIDKWTLVATVRALSEPRGLRLRLADGDRTRAVGSRLSLAIEVAGEPYLTLFNLSADGTVNLLFPLFSKSAVGLDSLLRVPRHATYAFELEAIPPAGADHVVAITSEAPLSWLHDTLRVADGKPATRLIRKVLVKSLDGATYRMAVQALYTVP